MLPVKRVKCKCPHCAKHLIVPAAYSKRRVKCNQCGGAFQLPDFERAYEDRISTWLDDRPAIVDNQQRDDDDDFNDFADGLAADNDEPHQDDPIESMIESDDPVSTDSTSLSLKDICPDVPLLQESDDDSLDDVDLSAVERELEKTGINLEEIERKTRQRQKRREQLRKLRSKQKPEPAPEPEPDDPIESMLDSDDASTADSGPLSLGDICPDVPLLQECDDDSIDDVDLAAVEKELEKTGIKLEDVPAQKRKRRQA